MKSTKVFSGTEAVELGFATRTQEFEEKRVEAPADDMRVAAAAYNIPANELDGRTSPRQQANQQKETTIMSQPSWMNKIKAALGLGDDKDEADTVLSVRELKSKADKADTLQSDYDAIVKEKEELEDKLSKIEADQETSEEEAEQKETEAKGAAVQAAIDSFRVKASDKSEWLDDYSDKPVEKLKAALDRIPEGACNPGGSDQPKGPNTKASATGSLNPLIAKDFGLN
jgi:chromosome segregation ATPase